MCRLIRLPAATGGEVWLAPQHVIAIEPLTAERGRLVGSTVYTAVRTWALACLPAAAAQALMAEPGDRPC